MEWQGIVMVPTVENAVNPVQSTANPTLFTSERARQAGLKSAQARKAKKERLATEHERLKAAATLAQPILAAAVTNAVQSEEFIQDKLARVRRQIALIDDKLESSDDPKEMKMCADALARLYEVESYLSGRPKPGSRRPGRERTSRQTRTVQPLDGPSSSSPTE